MGDRGDNGDGPGRSRGASSRHEGGTVMLGADRRSGRATIRIVLLAVALQGLTPDRANLASPWLLRLVTAVSVDDAASGEHRSSMLAPLDGREDGGDTGGICQGVAAHFAPRIRLDDGR